MKNTDDCCYEFGEFRLDPAEHTLTHGDHEIPLTPKAFDTLLVLVKEHGHLVTKDDLLDRVWPETHVEEANLAKHVSMIRKVLSENGLEEPFIDTVPKIGYRFVAPLNEIPPMERSVSGGDVRSERPDDSSETRFSERFRQIRNTVSQHKIVSVVAVVVVSVAVISAAYLLTGSAAAPLLSDNDVILLADFENKTGEDIFDGTLRQALHVELRQSPILSILPDDKVQQSLQLMKLSADDPVTRSIGREICQRRGLKALVLGSIVKLDNSYSITLEAIAAETGATLAIRRHSAEGKESILEALSELARDLRLDLGESLPKVKESETWPLVTTSSLDALKMYSQGTSKRVEGKGVEAFKLLKRAVELDPEFALAYLELAMVALDHSMGLDVTQDSIRKAYRLRERVGENERISINYLYSSVIKGDILNGIEELKIGKSRFPRNPTFANNLAYQFNWIGQYEDAIREANQALELNPDAFLPKANLIWSFVRLGRYDAARSIIREELSKGRDNAFWHNDLYTMAFVEKDTEKMHAELDWFRSNHNELGALNLEALAASYKGKWKQFLEIYSHKRRLMPKNGSPGTIDFLTRGEAGFAAVFDKCEFRSVKKMLPSKDFIVFYADDLFYTHAKCGSLTPEEPLIGELEAKYPNATLLNGFSIPVFRAARHLRRNDAKQAVEQLEITVPFERISEFGFLPTYLRGYAFLKMEENEKSRKEFQKILDNRGIAAMSVLYPLAQLGKARATRNKNEYEKFFEMWKDADPDLPILVEAKEEYQKLS